MIWFVFFKSSSTPKNKLRYNIILFSSIKVLDVSLLLKIQRKLPKSKIHMCFTDTSLNDNLDTVQEIFETNTYCERNIIVFNTDLNFQTDTTKFLKDHLKGTEYDILPFQVTDAKDLAELLHLE